MYREEQTTANGSEADNGIHTAVRRDEAERENADIYGGLSATLHHHRKHRVLLSWLELLRLPAVAREAERQARPASIDGRRSTCVHVHGSDKTRLEGSRAATRTACASDMFTTANRA